MQRIIEHKDVAKYIISRNLLNQYRKAKMYLLDNQHDTVKFKLRQPKSK